MSRKKKVSKGNPAKVSEPVSKGWKPSASIDAVPMQPKNVSRPHSMENEGYRKAPEKNRFVIATALFIVFLMVLTVIGSMLALTPSMQTPNDVPYQVPDTIGFIDSFGFIGSLL